MAVARDNAQPVTVTPNPSDRGEVNNNPGAIRGAESANAAGGNNISTINHIQMAVPASSQDSQACVTPSLNLVDL
jgi:hypothetical protein